MNDMINDQMILNRFFDPCKFKPGMKVRLIRTEQFPQLAGQWGTVSEEQIAADRIQVRFRNFLGFFPPDNLTEDRELRSDLYLLIRRREFLYDELMRQQNSLNDIQKAIRKFARNHHLCRRCGSVMERREDLDTSDLQVWKCSDKGCDGLDFDLPKTFAEEPAGGER